MASRSSTVRATGNVRVVIVVDIEVADTGNVSALVGVLREDIERVSARMPDAGIGMTAHVRDAADRIMEAVRLEMGAH